jgi:hypothetical protein
MESLCFRATFNVLAAGQPELIAHLSGFRQRDWPVVIINLAQVALVGGAVPRSNATSTPIEPVTQHVASPLTVADWRESRDTDTLASKFKKAFSSFLTMNKRVPALSREQFFIVWERGFSPLMARGIP